MGKGMPKKIYTYTEPEIARVAGVSIGALRVAKVRRKIVPNDLVSVSMYIIEHRLKRIPTHPKESKRRARGRVKPAKHKVPRSKRKGKR